MSSLYLLFNHIFNAAQSLCQGLYFVVNIRHGYSHSVLRKTSCSTLLQLVKRLERDVVIAARRLVLRDVWFRGRLAEIRDFLGRTVKPLEITTEQPCRKASNANGATICRVQ